MERKEVFEWFRFMIDEGYGFEKANIGKRNKTFSKSEIQSVRFFKDYIELENKDKIKYKNIKSLSVLV